MKLSILTAIFGRLPGRGAASSALTCQAAAALLRLHVDAMAMEAGPDAARLESHMAECPSCRGEYESLAAMRDFLQSSQRPSPPARLEMETRIKLSHARHADAAAGWAVYAADLLRPLAIRAVLSVSASMVLFGALAIGLVSNQTAIAYPGPDPSLQIYRPAHPTDETKAWLAGYEYEWEGLTASLLIEAYIGADGYVYGFRGVEGVDTPEAVHWVWDRLYWARFSPGTSFGVPVDSSVKIRFKPTKI